MCDSVICRVEPAESGFGPRRACGRLERGPGYPEELAALELHEYASLDTVGLAGLIRSGEVSASEVEAVARYALEQADADLNALTMPPFDPPLESEPGGPLHGVPFVIKDSGPFARGVPFALGSRAICGAVATVDHDLMSRFRQAGLVALGQSTAPEFGLSFSTEPVRHGPTGNPWSPGHGVGGSSGGSAALVAVGAEPPRTAITTAPARCGYQPRAATSSA